MKKNVIVEDFLRSVANLERYMNAYSMFLRNECLTVEEFNTLYDILCKIKDKSREN